MTIEACSIAVGRRHRVRRAWWLVWIVARVFSAEAEESEDDVSLPPGWKTQSRVVAEEELQPALESNRQPLGPDPLVLPQWSADEHAAFAAGRPVNLGGGLWSAERYPLQPVPPWPATEPARRAVPAGVLGWDLLSVYGASRAWCVDPQEVLEVGQRARLEDRLAVHARTAGYPVRVWMLAPGQSLTPALDDDTLHRANFGAEGLGVLAVVVAANPLDLRVVLPPTLASQAASWRESVVGQTTPWAASVDPLDRLVLCLTLSASSLPGAAAVDAKFDAHPDVISMEKPGHAGSSIRFLWWLAAATAGGVVVAGVNFMARRRARAAEFPPPSEPSVWVEIDRPRRLGGAHSGGSGAAIEW